MESIEVRMNAYRYIVADQWGKDPKARELIILHEAQAAAPPPTTAPRRRVGIGAGWGTRR